MMTPEDTYLSDVTAYLGRSQIGKSAPTIRQSRRDRFPNLSFRRFSMMTPEDTYLSDVTAYLGRSQIGKSAPTIGNFVETGFLNCHV